MNEQKSWLYPFVRQVCKEMPFAALLDIKVVSLDEGESIVGIPVTTKKHTNSDGFIHGGVLATLADMAMGVACATTGKHICTLEMNNNYIKNVPVGGELIANGRVIHNGKTTMVTETEIRDENGQLLVKGRGTFFVIGRYEERDLQKCGAD